MSRAGVRAQGKSLDEFRIGRKPSRIHVHNESDEPALSKAVFVDLSNRYVISLARDCVVGVLE